MVGGKGFPPTALCRFRRCGRGRRSTKVDSLPFFLFSRHAALHRGEAGAVSPAQGHVTEHTRQRRRGQGKVSPSTSSGPNEAKGAPPFPRLGFPLWNPPSEAPPYKVSQRGKPILLHRGIKMPVEPLWGEWRAPRPWGTLAGHALCSYSFHLHRRPKGGRSGPLWPP